MRLKCVVYEGPRASLPPSPCVEGYEVRRFALIFVNGVPEWQQIAGFPFGTPLHRPPDHE